MPICYFSYKTVFVNMNCEAKKFELIYRFTLLICLSLRKGNLLEVINNFILVFKMTFQSLSRDFEERLQTQTGISLSA